MISGVERCEFVEAAFELERAVQARRCDGRSTEVEAVGAELADAFTLVVYVYFVSAEEPLMQVIDLETPVTEATLDRAALKQALLSPAGCRRFSPASDFGGRNGF